MQYPPDSATSGLIQMSHVARTLEDLSVDLRRPMPSRRLQELSRTFPHFDVLDPEVDAS